MTNFFGFEKLQEIKANPPKQKRVGIRLVKGGVLREGCDIFNSKEKKIGKLTSGCFSPILKKGIGMGFVKTKFRKPGTKVILDIRGRKVTGVYTKLPFVEQRYYRAE